MTIVQTLGALANVNAGWMPMTGSGALRLYDQFTYDYLTIYKTQPNVRTCVDFLARNIAQLGLHVFRRVSETDRVRVRDHWLAETLSRPLPAACKVTRYRLIEALMGDLGVFFNAYWAKVKPPDQRLGLLRLPPECVTVQGGLSPSGYEVTMGGVRTVLAPEAVVHVRGYNPLSPIMGLSPLETLRRVLAEEHAAGEYREYFWQNSARVNGIVERSLEAPEWSEAARKRFQASFAEEHAGARNSAKTPVLEDGMTWKEASFNAQESEYLAGRKLTREECARAYHIPLPMVGILDHSTFSNIKEQHKNLYQDALGPWLALIEQDIELQLLPEWGDAGDLYVEFNIAEKLQGSFEEQTTAFQSAVGAPYMTRNEARARQNLPSLPGGDDLVTPLNVLTGGQASPRDSAPKAGSPERTKAAAEVDTRVPGLRERHEAKWREVLVHYFERQEAVLRKRAPKGRNKGILEDLLFDLQRWDEELAADLFALNVATATVWARLLARQIALDFQQDMMLEYLRENARISAENINAATVNQVEEASLTHDLLEAIGTVFVVAVTVRAAEIAVSKVTTASNFGTQEAARQGGLKTKTWQVNSANPRDDHAAMDGETVGIGELFSNGMRWPGDPAGGAENNANCQCSVAFGR